MIPTFYIERDGFFFRAIGPNFRSPLLTSASQAGLLIERKAGRDAHRAAFDHFVAEVR